MQKPNLKRVKVNSEQELRQWLARNNNQADDVMVVTVASRRGPNHLSRDHIAASLSEFGWRADRAYTLNGGLHGQVIHRVGDQT